MSDTLKPIEAAVGLRPLAHHRNFKKYVPDGDTQVMYCRDENGVDWYESQANFRSDESTLKVQYDQNGRIVAQTRDVSRLYPEGFSVLEVITDLPDTTDFYNLWCVVEGQMVPYRKSDEELAKDARAKRSELLSVVDAIAGNALRWSALSAEQQHEIAQYRQALLDISEQAEFPREVNWPQVPASLK